MPLSKAEIRQRVSAGRLGQIAQAKVVTHEMRVAWGRMGSQYGYLGGAKRLTLSELRRQEEKKREEIPTTLRGLKLAWNDKLRALEALS